MQERDTTKKVEKDSGDEGSLKHVEETSNEKTVEKNKSEEVLVAVYDNRPDGYDGSCLRPLGLCDLGGCCDSCWYSPDHPRFRNK